MDLIDKLIIYAVCLAIFIVDTGYAISVVPVIFSLTISSLISYFDKKTFKLSLMGAYIVVCLFRSDFLIFLPLICYDIFATKEQLMFLTAFVPIFIHLHECSTLFLIMLPLLFMVSYLLKYRTLSLSKMHDEFIKFRDNAKEQSILLEKKNSELMEKQDYEINVATLNERNRIAMEIHDNVGHLLSRCLLQLGAIMAINRDENLKEGLSSIKNTLSSAMDSIRNSVHDLHDDSIDLYSQINELVNGFTFCDIHLDYDISNNISKKLKYCFIAIVKEALSNIIEYSTATEVNIILHEHPALYQLIVRDNGHVSEYNINNGIGLYNITQRVNSLNGNIHINTENGFKIFISIPKDR